MTADVPYVDVAELAGQALLEEGVRPGGAKRWRRQAAHGMEAIRLPRCRDYDGGAA